jgi:hypothetical protein
MAASDYHFVTAWRVPGRIEAVSALLEDPLDLPRWWPSVYLAVEELPPAADGRPGRRFALHTRGWLPYTLRWEMRVTESRPPHGFSLEALGDFVGRGIWRLQQQGAEVAITFDWRVRADKPLLRRLSFLLKPLFAANHRWAMRQGEISLRRELARLDLVG